MIQFWFIITQNSVSHNAFTKFVQRISFPFAFAVPMEQSVPNSETFCMIHFVLCQEEPAYFGRNWALFVGTDK